MTQQMTADELLAKLALDPTQLRNTGDMRSRSPIDGRVLAHVPVTSESSLGDAIARAKSAQSRWNVTYGGLGLHLAGDTRMTLRLRKGGLGIVMRHSF